MLEGEVMSRAIAAYHGAYGRACLYELDRPMAMHAHREGHLLFHIDGPSFASEVDGQQIPVGPSTGAAISPFQPHDFEIADESDPILVLVLYIKTSWFLGDDHKYPTEFRFGTSCIAIDDDVQRAIDQVTRLLQTNESEIGLEPRLHALMQICYQRSWGQIAGGEPPNICARVTQDARIRKSIRVMKARVGEDLHLQDIAIEVGLSRPHFFRLFRENMGITPNVYLNTLRMEKAIDQLINTEQAVTSIGLDLGFASQASFTRFFGANVGIPPTDYRRVVRRQASLGQSMTIEPT